MSKYVSLGLAVLSLIGFGITFQMAEDTMNWDSAWTVEGNFLHYINPVALVLCSCALSISLVSFLIQNNRTKAQYQKDEQ